MRTGETKDVCFAHFQILSSGESFLLARVCLSQQGLSKVRFTSVDRLLYVADQGQVEVLVGTGVYRC